MMNPVEQRKHMTDTIFDKILKKEIPADVVYEDEDVLAFRDVNPQAPIHILEIPKNKFEGFANLSDADPQAVGAYITKVSKVAKLLNLEEGYRIVFNQGQHGQQTVHYIHAHILAGRQMQWPPG